MLTPADRTEPASWTDGYRHGACRAGDVEVTPRGDLGKLVGAVHSSMNAEMVEQIESEDLTGAQVEAARSYLSRFQYSATALAALAAALRELEDEVGTGVSGSEFLLRSAHEMAIIDAELA